ncbi:hypothetical protein FFLO_00190 [Filobasidium floriforme]|uniref:Uncharacterized protein n=1 Tax=Filobasidium floriforme TaxID=5210 RepID=A0A8K0JRZ1_9TREE|nr:uncharacterized protein HD553DRAFT_308000 [Filobasidium floriforme]KAG7579982.1 hypothetical protein FFLO_00190 [Filobasidium floriforme]KAH8087382.1 hypothetical protein HD553DRAFT_308000 [Filobasidium floriforme]
MVQDDLASSPPRSLSQSNLSSESSAWILPSPHESDTSNRSAQYLTIPEPRARAVVSTAPHEKDKDEHQTHTPRRRLSRGSTTSSVTSTQAIAGSTGGTDDSGMMIMPDDLIETGDFRYPTPETFGPQYWERRRELWLSGQLYPHDPTLPQAGPYLGSNNLPWTSPEAANVNNNGTSSHNSLSHYLGLSMKARGKLPSFLVNALPGSSSAAAANPHANGSAASTDLRSSSGAQNPSQALSAGAIVPSNPSSLAQDRAGANPNSNSNPMSYSQYQTARSTPNPLVSKKGKGGGADDPIDRLEALLAEPGSEESDRVWKQGGLEAVWKFLIDGKMLKRGIRLGLAVKILRAGWIHDGTWPASYTLSGASKSQLEMLNNDPFFASPPKQTTALPPTLLQTEVQDTATATTGIDMQVDANGRPVVELEQVPEPIDIPQTTDSGRHPQQ